MKKLLAVAVAFVLIPTLIRAQGAVNFSAINGTTFSNLMGTAAWVAVMDTKNDFIQVGGNTVSFSLAAGSSISVLLTEGGGNVELTALLQAGAANAAGLTTNVSASSLAPISGIAIALLSPLQSFDPHYSMAIGNILLSGQASPIGLDTVATPFSGMSGIFSSDSSSFNLSFDIASSGATRSQVVLLGLTPSPVPEPASMALVGLGGLAMLAFKRKR